MALAACHSGGQPAAASGHAPAKDSIRIFKAAALDSKNDPVCGMPSTAGMEDTLMLNGKVIGFCSKECKQEYLKNPKQYPVAYK